MLIRSKSYALRTNILLVGAFAMVGDIQKFLIMWIISVILKFFGRWLLLGRHMPPHRTFAGRMEPGVVLRLFA